MQVALKMQVFMQGLLLPLRDFNILYVCVYAWSPVDAECGPYVFWCRNVLRSIGITCCPFCAAVTWT
jgi:hypothetical protein